MSGTAVIRFAISVGTGVVGWMIDRIWLLDPLCDRIHSVLNDLGLACLTSVARHGTSARKLLSVPFLILGKVGTSDDWESGGFALVAERNETRHEF